MDNAGKKFFLNRYKQLGEEIQDSQIKSAIRINTLKTTASELLPRLEKLGIKLEKIPYTTQGYFVKKTNFSLGAITEHLLGYYYLQEAAAQIPVEILNPEPTDTVLDCCAAPGGKTTQLAALMNNQGKIISYELKPHRITSLIMNLERCGVTNTTVFSADATDAKKLGIQFDKILLDAPCSGNYALEKDWFEKRDLNGIKQSSRIQRKILRTAIDVLKPNGSLVYSTCSLEPEENELNIQWALDNLPVHIEKINLPVGDEGITNIFEQKLNDQIKNCKRFWPHKTNTQGFFVARLVKI
ncbi:hypothetical protein COV18_03980 [Candidatus Woesearchaeota archaeon CG10_big_fil_rev_8_21_14_0_10_37_12]|nr:MAG: hypothetical protein COV18_03980 [Candidatus Woesearchaeota archaeon CG10_big_fil_rev_8_21_14_0_10_37_12]